MKKKGLLLFSFGMLMVLLTEANASGIIQSGLIFLIGAIYILVRNSTKDVVTMPKPEIKSIVLLLGLFIVGLFFCKRWSYSSLIMSVATAMHMTNKTLLIIVAVVLGVCSYYCTSILWDELIRLWSKVPVRYQGICVLVIAILTTNFLPQFMLGITTFEMGLFRFLAGSVIVFVLVLFLYALFGCYRASVIVAVVFFVGGGTANAYIYSFRGVMLEPMDIFSVRTALNVAESYSLFPIPTNVIEGWIIAGLVIAWIIKTPIVIKSEHCKKCRIQSLIASVGLGLLLTIYTIHLPTYHWYMEGAYFSGYILDFFAKIKEVAVREPDGYDVETISTITAEYDFEEAEDEAKTPHIIVIMNESFSDLNVIGEFSTNIEVTPYMSTIEKDTIKGYALASVFGGNTPNSEFEFLTGNSMAWLPSGTIPYQQYVKEGSYSVVSHLKDTYDYTCIAMHPFNSSGWSRTSVYDHLGFDEWMFVEDFPQENMLRDYVSDYEMFEKLIDIYEENKENSLFLFGVTMQNHGGYLYEGENYEQTVVLEDYPGVFPKAEQYLSCIRETDKAVEMLVEYYKKVDEPVVIVFFGDHLPRVEDEFYEKIHGDSLDTLDEMQNKYKVPFFVWANYDIEEQYVECTSLNYLTNFMYRAAGMELPIYNQFLEDVREVVLAMNANGYYSMAQGQFVTYEQAEGTEAEVLRMYEMLQYNEMFDTENRSDVFEGGN